MRVLDLFSGIGGFSLGLERAGMRTVAFCEIDPYCRRVLAKHWPDVPIFGDIRELTGAEVLANADGGRPLELEPVNRGIRAARVAQEEPARHSGIDVICGGFPCQDISVAGKGTGIGGERSGLWTEYARIVGELRPRYVIVENVAALLGRGLSVVLGDLAALGYDCEWHCIPASVVGAPHRRDRVWIVAYPQERTERAGLPPAGTDNNRWRNGSSDRGADVGDTIEPGLEGCVEPGDVGLQGTAGQIRSTWAASLSGWPSDHWLTEPDVGRVAHGVPARVDRLRGLGNAVVPLQARTAFARLAGFKETGGF